MGGAYWDFPSSGDNRRSFRRLVGGGRSLRRLRTDRRFRSCAKGAGHGDCNRVRLTGARRFGGISFVSTVGACADGPQKSKKKQRLENSRSTTHFFSLEARGTRGLTLGPVVRARGTRA